MQGSELNISFMSAYLVGSMFHLNILMENPYLQMIVEPDQRVPDFVKAGADIVSVHCEQSSTIHLHRTVNQVTLSFTPLFELILPIRLIYLLGIGVSLRFQSSCVEER